MFFYYALHEFNDCVQQYRHPGKEVNHDVILVIDIYHVSASYGFVRDPLRNRTTSDVPTMVQMIHLVQMVQMYTFGILLLLTQHILTGNIAIHSSLAAS